MTFPVVYLGHPLSAPTREGIEANRRSAAKWAVWIAKTFRVAVSADWIWMTGELDETPENRAFGLECDRALVARCDAMVMVGPRVSEGMRLESEHARTVISATGRCPECPGCGDGS
jgi:hypothetical protein